jgi:hypothetical protein
MPLSADTSLPFLLAAYDTAGSRAFSYEEVSL